MAVGCPNSRCEQQMAVGCPNRDRAISMPISAKFDEMCSVKTRFVF
jgi:hypothetical protein